MIIQYDWNREYKREKVLRNETENLGTREKGLRCCAQEIESSEMKTAGSSSREALWQMEWSIGREIDGSSCRDSNKK